MRAYPHLAIALVFAQGLACRSQAETVSVEPRFDALYRQARAATNLRSDARAGIMAAAYDGAFAPEYASASFHDVDDDGVDLLFRAAQMTASCTLAPRHIDQMMSALSELQHRERAMSRHYRHAQETLLKARMLPEARALASLLPDGQQKALPEFREADNLEPGQPTEWVVDPTRNELVRRSVDLRPVDVVVVSHPRCHFANAAMQAIEADPVLRDRFRAHARWLAPPDGRLEVEAIQRWNREHADEAITLAFRAEEWSMIDSWATPTFYFLRDGVVKAKVEGWSSDRGPGELLAAFRAIEIH